MGILVRRRFLSGAAALLCVFVWLSGQAGGLRFDRTRIDLSKRNSMSELNIENTGTDLMLVQTEAFAWAQRDGSEELTPTTDLLVSPPIFEVAPGARQLLRVGFLGPVAGDREAAYRLILQEVPRALGAEEEVTIAVALRISLPVFVTPPGPTAPVLDWRATRTSAGGVRLTLANSGNAHVKLLKFDVSLPDGTLLAKEESFTAYVLPGETRTWDLATAEQWSARRVRVSATTEQGEVHADLELEGS